MTPLLCQVCLSEQAIGVCASALAPVSYAMCALCNAAGAETYETCIYVMASADKGDLIPGVEEIVANSLVRCGKTREQFDQDVQNTLKTWEQMSGESGP